MENVIIKSDMLKNFDENGIIEIQCAEQLDAIYQNDEKSWREMSITEFVDSLVSKLASVSVS